MIPNEIKFLIEQHLESKIESSISVSGGCISDTSVIHMNSGKKYFLKVNNNIPSDMFTKEANGLVEIDKSHSIRVPIVRLVNHNFILMEYIDEKEKSKTFFEDFGIAFAKMHQCNSPFFGFHENNYIGSTLQKNLSDQFEQNDWTKFYFNKRLLFQFKLAEKNGYIDSGFRKYFIQLENKIDIILKSENEKPSLLHGDLWSGNYIADENGRACLIDPAVYYGNREADLAMTKLFGGFTKDFYSSYNEFFPLKDGYNFRENIYKLYHVLNHLNLFGMSYYQQALSLIKFYL